MNLIGRAYQKIVRESDSLLRETGGRAGIYNQFYRNANGGRIVVYHGVCKSDHTRFSPVFLEQQTLEAHFRFYKKHFNVVSLDDFFEHKLSGQKFRVCLSFDDGLANNLDYVLPLLEKYELPAAFFITGAREAGYDILWNDFLNIVSKYGPLKLEYKGNLYIKNNFGRYVDAKGLALAEILRAQDFEAKKEMMELLAPLAGFRNNPADEEYWRLMSDAQIKKLSGSPWATIGSHGYYHNDLARIDIDKTEKELIKSKQYLERVTGKVIRSIAFPYGSYSSGVKEMALRAGYKQLLGTETLLPEDEGNNNLIGRLTVNPFIPVHAQMQAIIKGYYARWK
jgi:peptidoglycan/xylan/chitin deacetylase (PgdA/CDA1 family)